MKGLPVWAKCVVAGAVLILTTLAVVAAFPWGLLVGVATRPLSAALGRTVTIGHARRVDWVSFVPVIELGDVTVAQPGWAGPGAMARIATVRVRLPVLPLLFGHVRPQAIDLSGAMLELRRDATGRANWEGDTKSAHGRNRPSLAHLTIIDSRLHLIDAKRHVELVATLVSDAAHGLLVEGGGTHRGRSLALALHGAALGDADPRAPYPIRLGVRSPLAELQAAGRLDHPLDLSGITAHVVASGQDLLLLDDYLQAGLFATVPFTLAADIRRDGDDWRIRGLGGEIGRSRLVADLHVVHADRTRITGKIAAATLDFDDFASAADRAKGAAMARAIGPRVLPDTRIKLDGLKTVDGAIRVDAGRLLGAAPFETLHADVRLDRRRLTVAPLTVGMSSGTMTGSAVVDDRGALPRLTLDLRVRGATIEALFVPDGAVKGPFAGRVEVTGSGDTVRVALAHADGTTGFAVPSGSVRRDYATYLGGDMFKSVGVAVSGGDGRVPLRCLVGSFRARDGVLIPDPLILDAAVSRGDGSGRITLADERLDLVLSGRSKHPGPLVSTAPAHVFGTLSAPEIDVRPPRAEDDGKTGTLDRIGFFLKKLRRRADLPGRAAAPNADCAGLARRVLR